MTKKSILGLVSAVAIGASLTACGSNSDSDASAAGGSSDSSAGDFGNCEITSKANSISVEPATPGTLTVETSLPGVGWFNGTAPENIKDGYEYCMAANLANMAGLKSVTLRNVSFQQLVAGRTNDFDIALAQISITDERKKVVDFSTPYFGSDIGVLIAKGDDVTEDNIGTKTCGVRTGTTAVDLANDTVGCETKVYQDSPTMYQAVLSGQVDAVFLDTAVVLAQAKSTGDKLEVVGQYDTGEEYGGIYPKGSPNEDAINEGIQTMEDDGTLAELSKTYLGPAFGADPSSVPVWQGK